MSIVFQDTWLIPSLFINYMFMYRVHVMDTSHSLFVTFRGIALHVYREKTVRMHKRAKMTNSMN